MSLEEAMSAIEPYGVRFDLDASGQECTVSGPLPRPPQEILDALKPHKKKLALILRTCDVEDAVKIETVRALWKL